MEEIELLGRPISKKRNYLRSRNGRMYLSSTWKKWEEEALWQLKKYKTKHTGPICVNYVFFVKGNYKVDLDNLIAGINDILQEAEIIDDDKNIVEIGARKEMGWEKWSTLIEIKPAQ